MNAVLTFIWAIVAIPLMIGSSDTWGPEGVAFSRLIGVAVTVPIMFYVEKRFLGSVHWKFWAEMILKVGLAAAALVLIERVIFSQFHVTWPVLIFGSILGTLGYGLILLLVGFVKPDERAMVMKMLGRDYQVVQ
jgi:hypothetical protein